MGIFDVFRKKENNPITEIETQLNKYQIEEYLNGAYKAIPQHYKNKVAELVNYAYKPFENKFLPFGLTWMGNCLAVDLREPSFGQVLLFEIGTNDVLEIPVTIPEFFKKEMIDFPDAVLATSFYEEWLSNGGSKTSIKQCAGYKVPLFLGGEDDVSNLEISDLEVYWGILGQIKNSI